MMNSKKRSVIISCIVVSLLLAGIVSASYVFYSMAVSATVSQENVKVISVPSKTSAVIDSDSNTEYDSVNSLYNVCMSNKWSRLKASDNTGYLSNQFVALNTAGSTINKYETSQSGTTKAITTLKTGPGGSYSDVAQIPLGKTLELLGEIINPVGEKWLMYKYAYAIYYIASKDIDIIVQPTTPITPVAPTKISKPTPPTPPTIPPTPTATTNGQKIVSLAYSKLGCAYVYGATGPNAFDCSGFVYWVVNNSGISGLSVPRTSIALYNQFSANNIGTSVANARPGDIILFSTNGTASGISHSAIYFKDSTMIHASTSSTGVILTTVAYSTSNKSVFAIIRLPGV